MNRTSPSCFPARSQYALIILLSLVVLIHREAVVSSKSCTPRRRPPATAFVRGGRSHSQHAATHFLTLIMRSGKPAPAM